MEMIILIYGYFALCCIAWTAVGLLMALIAEEVFDEDIYCDMRGGYLVLCVVMWPILLWAMLLKGLCMGFGATFRAIKRRIKG